MSWRFAAPTKAKTGCITFAKAWDCATASTATKLAQKADEAFGDQLAITGHSLGGGLAAASSLATGAPAVTFNAAGLHDNTIERLGLDPDAVRSELERGDQIRRYAVDHEILTALQERNLLTRGLLPDAVGHKIELPDPEPLSGWKRPVPGSSLKHGLELHGMDAVLESQQQAARDSISNPAHPGNALFSHRMVHLDKAQAASQPIQHGSAQVLAPERQTEQQTALDREPRRMMATP